jgi:competence protein ComEC
VSKNIAIEFQFYKSPFLVITLSVILGIVCSSYFCSNTSLYYFLFSITLLFLDSIYSFGKIISYIIIVSVFFTLGLLSYNSSILKINYGSKKYYVAQVNNIYNSSSEWKRVEIELLDEKSGSTNILLIAKSFNFNISDIIGLDLNLNRIENKGNPGEFDTKKYYRSKDIVGISFYDNTNNSIDLIQHRKQFGLSYYLSSIRLNLISIIDSNMSFNNGALAKALLLGDKSSLDESIKQDFSNTGAMHVLAVSGLHIGILLSIIIYILSLLSKFLSKKQALLIALFILWFYAIITGLSASILRATFMFSILVLSKFFSKTHSSVNSLCFTAFILLLINPNYVYDIGFQLSYLAMFGIFSFYNIIYSIFSFRNRVINMLWKGTSVGLAAQLFTFPLTIFYFHQFPNYFILTNLGLIVITGIILSFGVLSIVFSKVGYLNKFLFYLLSLTIIILIKLISSISSLPYSVAYGFNFTLFDVLSTYFIILISLLFFKSNKLNRIISPLILVTLFYVEYNRFQNLNCSELVFFNSKKPLFVIKDGSKSICFYFEDIKNAKYIMSSYSKIKPSKVLFQNINDYEEINISNKKINLNVRKITDQVLININNEKYFLSNRIVKSDFVKYKDYHFISIKGKNDPQSIPSTKYLEEGALFYAIKKTDHKDRI